MPKKSTWQRDHPACAAATREAVEAVRAEKDREIEELRSLLAQAERVVLKRYLITGGLHVDLVVEMRRALGLPDELTDEDRALVDGMVFCAAHDENHVPRTSPGLKTRR